MSKQITLTVRDDVWQLAEEWAAQTGQGVSDVLADAIDASLEPFVPPVELPPSMANWPDDKILAAADAMMTPTDNQRLSDLLDRQQAEKLNGEETRELQTLMRSYGQQTLHKAEAIAEAARRGLRPAPRA